jgi:hypothetical protein
MNSSLKSKFSGNSLEVTPSGSQKCKFKDNNDTFVFHQPKSSAQNLLIGKMYVDHRGDATLDNTQTGDYCHINFKTYGMFSKKSSHGLVNAKVYDADGNIAYEIYGKWTEALYYKIAGESDDTGVMIWQMFETPDNWKDLYYIPDIALQYNNLPEQLRGKLPPTDSRFRTDQRCLEEGELERANGEKKRLENKQRTRMNLMKKNKEDYKPRYFEEENDEDTKGNLISFRYIGGYWKDRKKQNWAGMPDLFGYNSD